MCAPHRQAPGPCRRRRRSWVQGATGSTAAQGAPLPRLLSSPDGAPGRAGVVSCGRPQTHSRLAPTRRSTGAAGSRPGARTRATCTPGSGARGREASTYPCVPPSPRQPEDFVTLVGRRAIRWAGDRRLVYAGTTSCSSFKARKSAVTMLWHIEWRARTMRRNGQHRGVIRIEDGCAAGAAGHRAAWDPNPVGATGVPTCLRLAPHHPSIVPPDRRDRRPRRWSAVTDYPAVGPHG